MGRYVRCPFFRHDKKVRSLACEDIYHTYSSPAEKYSWMDAYCCDQWEDCPYARDLDTAYTMYEKGDEMALDNEKIEAMEKEMHKLATLVGKQAKKIEARDQEIRELRRKNKELDEKKDALLARIRIQTKNLLEMDKKIDHLEKRGLANIKASLDSMKESFELGLCYFLAKEDGPVPEETFRAWAEEQDGTPRVLVDLEVDKNRTFSVVYEKQEEPEEEPAMEVSQEGENDHE